MTIAPGGPRHRTGTMNMDIGEVVRVLIDAFTANLVASMVGVKDPGQARKWAKDVLAPRLDAEQRLRFALDVFGQLEMVEGRAVAQRWFLSINPRLGYSSPVKAIREGAYAQVAAAATALTDGAYDG